MNDPHELDSPAALAAFIDAHPAAAVWFSAPDCGVCQVLRPRIETLLEQRFPQVAWGRVDCAGAAELAAQNGVFAVPTLVVWLEGREFLRRARQITPAEVAASLERPYAMLFGA